MYLSTESLINSYNELSSVEYKNDSILHIFLILKGCGFNSIEEKSVDLISKNGIPFARNLSSLFDLNEVSPEKFEFINPFSMKRWGKQSPSEKLEKWVKSRIKNNVIGGATTWRRIIREDVYNSEFKFSKNYVDEIKNLTLVNKKIDLLSMAVWYFKFHTFSKEISESSIIRMFINEINLSEKEISILFSKKLNYKISFNSTRPNFEKIRSLIGSPLVSEEKWIKSIEKQTFNLLETKEYEINPINMNTKNPDIDHIFNVIKSSKQLILSGPSGTSKSFFSKELSKKIASDESRIINIQFHPSYTYQEFIGGFIVSEDKVTYNQGILIRIIKNCLNDINNNYVLIIDEINRANLSSVFGELIQCLDRDNTVTYLAGNKLEKIFLPKNLFIIGTMNTTDRTLSSFDLALKRRFLNINFSVDYDMIFQKVSTEYNFSASDFLKKINQSLIDKTGMKDFVIGHAVFLSDEKISEGSYFWSNQDFNILFNHKILPIVEEYCNNDQNLIVDIIGDRLINCLYGEEFEESIQLFME